MPKSFEKIRSNLFAVIHFQKPEGIYISEMYYQGNPASKIGNLELDH